MAERVPVLVVAAAEALRERISAAFSARGYRAAASPEAAHGWDLFQRDVPPLVLVDWGLPGGAAARLVKQVRQRDGGADVLVVALVAAGRGEEDPLEAGADDVLDPDGPDGAFSARVGALAKRLSVRAVRLKAEAASREAREEIARSIRAREDRPGSPLGILEEQVAERLRAEAESERLAAALECADEAIAITDPDGRFFWVNGKFEEVTGWSRDEVKGKNPRILKSGRHGWEFYRDLWATLSVGDTWRKEFTNRRKNGEIYEVEQSISPVRDRSGRTFAFVAIQRDVSERKKREAALRQAGQALAVARDEAVAASRAKSAFLGSVSHELRTPLNAILGLADLIDETAGAASPESLRRDVSRIRAAGMELTQKVNDLLDVSRLESGEVDLDVGPCGATPVLRSAAEAARKAAGEKAAPLTVDVPDDLGAVEADPSRLRRIVEGLLANAFVHGHGSPVALRARRDEEGVEVVVADGGPGIPPDRLALVFTPFSAPDGRGGLGLTLAVAHRLAHMMGGNLAVESAPGQGTAARLRLKVPPAGRKP